MKFILMVYSGYLYRMNQETGQTWRLEGMNWLSVDEEEKD